MWSEIGYASGVALALTGLGGARIEAGDMEQGRRDLLDAEERFAVLGSTIYLPYVYRYLASAELGSGNLSAATAFAEKALDAVRGSKARHQEAATQRVMAEIAIGRGDTKAARRLLEASRQTLAEVGDALDRSRT